MQDGSVVVYDACPLLVRAIFFDPIGGSTPLLKTSTPSSVPSVPCALSERLRTVA